VGFVGLAGGIEHAGLWNGTAASWVDLHTFLPSEFITSKATGIWNDGSFTYVVGYGHNNVTSRNEALMWASPVPEPASLLALVAGFAFLRFRRLKN
jgi:hypothetical protein